MCLLYVPQLTKPAWCVCRFWSLEVLFPLRFCSSIEPETPALCPARSSTGSHWTVRLLPCVSHDHTLLCSSSDGVQTSSCTLWGSGSSKVTDKPKSPSHSCSSGHTSLHTFYSFNLCDATGKKQRQETFSFLFQIDKIFTLEIPNEKFVYFFLLLVGKWL